IQTPRITVHTPLPPIVNPNGVTIESSGARAVVEVAADVGPVFDIAAPDAFISNLRIVGGEREAILIRGDGARSADVGGERSAVGVALARGRDRLVVERSEFDGNTLGIQLYAGPQHVTIANNRFRGHTTAAVWAVARDHVPADA